MVGSDDASVAVLVTVAPDRRADIDGVVESLRAAGMGVDTVLRTIGVVTGTATAAQAAAVARLPGVVAVEPDRPVQAWGDPGAH